MRASAVNEFKVRHEVSEDEDVSDFNQLVTHLNCTHFTYTTALHCSTSRQATSPGLIVAGLPALTLNMKRGAGYSGQKIKLNTDYSTPGNRNTHAAHKCS